MASKSTKKATAGGNGKIKRSSVSGRFVSKRSDSTAVVLTERAWKKTYENRGKSKARA